MGGGLGLPENLADVKKGADLFFRLADWSRGGK